MRRLDLPPLLSWSDFLDAATAEPSISHGASRQLGSAWEGADWDEAVRLGVDGWPQALEDVDVTVDRLRESAGLSHEVTLLEPAWDVTGSEVDVGAYLAGVPECMVDFAPRRVSRRGKVVTFVVPAGYVNTTGHHAIVNRGLALATLCAAIIDAGHSVEIWSGFAGMLHTSKHQVRFSCSARVITPGEPFDLGRLIFAMAHPAMLRRLWFGVWDAQPAKVAKLLNAHNYGTAPYTCEVADLPSEITDPYLFPYLTSADRQWDDLSTALAWSRGMFGDLGLIEV